MNAKPELEKAIIGAIILDPDKILDVSDIVQPEDFGIGRPVIDSIFGLYADGKSCDLESIAVDLGSSLALIGGLKYLTDCATCVPTSANAVHHANLLRSMSLKSRIKAWGTQIANRDFDEPRNELARIEGEILELSDSVRESRKPDQGSILYRINQRQKKIEAGDAPWVETDFWGSMIPGYYAGHMWLVTGYTSYGKSLLLSSMLADACRNGGRVLIFSTEDSQEEKLMGLRGVIADVPKAWQLRGDIAAHKEALVDADIEISQWNPIIYDTVTDLDEMRLKAKKHVLRDKVNIVGIDYAQGIESPAEGIYERMSGISRGLYAMINELQVTGIVLSQISNEAAKAKGPVIGAKGGGDLPAAADIVINIARDQNNKQQMDLQILKNRPFGPTGKRSCRFTDRWTAIEYDYNRGIGG